MQKLTPLMQQYTEIKAQHEDKILLFRMGDFYEMFARDAETAAPILNIALTQRNKKSGDETKMCGVPHHSIATPIAKLLSAGHRVAICDQIEDPATAKGIVKRAVTKVLTPGMIYDPETLDQVTSNYMCSFNDKMAAFADVTTGEAFYFHIEKPNDRENLLTLLKPVEVVLNPGPLIELPILVSRFSCDGDPRDLLRKYIEHMQGPEVVKLLQPFVQKNLSHALRLNDSTMKSLEIFQTLRGEKSPTLFSAINRTQTAAGSRLLKNWLAFPLTDLREIEYRLSRVEHWLSKVERLRRVRELLRNMGDIERRLSRLNTPAASARDLLALAESLNIGLSALELAEEGAQNPQIKALASEILETLNDSPPLSVKEGEMIRRGVHADLDQLIDLSENAERLLSEFEAREKEKTKINSLKVRYNNVFGYYIELTKTHAEKAPSHYRRKQTLTNAERFTNDELDGLEEKILSARSKRSDMEFALYTDLCKVVLNNTPELLSLARRLSELDIFCGWAWLALERNYSKPKFSNKYRLVHARHPVVEQDRNVKFNPNSIELKSGEAYLLTGPNMAGKSTLMKQVGVISLLAQIGCYVPANDAELPMLKQICTRIGASDDLNLGLSTFMVEMTEAAEILANANEETLIIMDEIGRGTSTYDGLSLAQSILEYLVSKKAPFVLFATHYHELTKLASDIPGIKNAHMAIHEQGGEIQFLHSLRPGPANRSYGIHVARLAKIPKEVLKRAENLLRDFEDRSAFQQLELGEPREPSIQPKNSGLLEEIANTDVSVMTPLEALNTINKWRQRLI